MSDLSKIEYCSHCNNRAPQKVVYENTFIGDSVEDDSGELIPLYNNRSFVTVCQTCSMPLFYMDEAIDRYDALYSKRNLREEDILKISFYNAELIWPATVKLNPSAIPKKIIEIYQEALKIKPLAPNAFVTQIRRALEAICLDHGIQERTLHESLKKFTEQGKLPFLLSEVTSIIKLIGNAGAHVGGPPVYNNHVLAIDDFFRVVLEYLYIAPYKLKKFKDEASKFNM